MILSEAAVTDALSLQQILAVEDAREFADVTCPSTGILVWPAIRNDLIRLIISDLLFKEQPWITVSPNVSLPGLGRSAAVALRAALHNAGSRPSRADVLLYSTGSGLVDGNGCRYNRYTQHFAQVLNGRAWAIEALTALDWPNSAREPNLSYSLPQMLLAKTLARLRVGTVHRRIAARLVDAAASRGADKLGWTLGAARRDVLVERCAAVLAGFPLQARIVERWLRRVRPRLLLAEEGCYGYMAVINATARDYGAVVAEFQHGVIMPSNDIYNVAPTLARSPAYRSTLPHYLLTYGDWWHARGNAPVRKFVIGNPHREEITRRLPRGGTCREVLVLGDGLHTDAHLDFCRTLSVGLAPDLDVVFRPHPRERGRFASPEPAVGGVRIDCEPDIYASFARATSVVAQCSSALFEAIGLVDRVFAWGTDKTRFFWPDHPFVEVHDASDLIDKLRAPGCGRIDANGAEAMWAQGWKTRFLDFLSSVCRIPADTAQRRTAL